MIKNNQLQEPMATYLAVKKPINLLMQLLDDAKFAPMPNNLVSDYDLLTITRRGLPKKSLVDLSKNISITLHELAGILHISERTLQRYDANELIKTEYSEKAIELARLYAHGTEIFGSLENFIAWMKTPSIVFKNETPISLLDTVIGFNLIFQELGKIEHGVFS
jgi:putative toxin-antitoxin system antitoxin component (TIGR02293 family)